MVGKPTQLTDPPGTLQDVKETRRNIATPKRNKVAKGELTPKHGKRNWPLKSPVGPGTRKAEHFRSFFFFILGDPKKSN